MADEQLSLSFSDVSLDPDPSVPAPAMVPLGDIAMNPTTVPADLLQSIKQYGVLVPVTLVRDENGFTVADGRRRIQAAASLGHIGIPAVIYDPRRAERASETINVTTLMLNAVRSVSVVAEYDAITALLKQGLTEGAVARLTGMARATITNRLKLAKLIVGAWPALRDGRLSVNVAMLWATKLDPLTQGALLMANDFSRAGVKAAMQATAGDAETQGVLDAAFDTGGVGERYQRVFDALSALVGAERAEAIAAGRDKLPLG